MNQPEASSQVVEQPKKVEKFCRICNTFGSVMMICCLGYFNILAVICYGIAVGLANHVS